MQKIFSFSDFIKIFSLCAVIISACACNNPDGSINKKQTGTLIGAGMGALVGSAFGGGSNGHLAGAAIGSAFGAVAGNMIGKSLDDKDRYLQEQAYNNALEHNKSGISSKWINPDSGTHGAIMPHKTYRKTNGQYCREFTQKITIGSKTEEAVGHACRNEDGSWTIMN